jgi:hypothetical protein
LKSHNIKDETHSCSTTPAPPKKTKQLKPLFRLSWVPAKITIEFGNLPEVYVIMCRHSSISFVEFDMVVQMFLDDKI